MTEIIDGKQIANQIAEQCKKDLNNLNFVPKLAIVVISPDSRAKRYVELKMAKAKEIGIQVEIFDWSGLSHEACLANMRRLADNTAINGIIVQLPVHGLDNQQSILDIIPPNKDVDGLSSAGTDDGLDLIPATPKAILELLRYSDVSLKDKNILVVGQGKLVGQPLTKLLKKMNYKVMTADEDTNGLKDLCKSADIIISATGQPNTINAEMISSGVVVIDAGISEVGDKMLGDVNYEGMENIASKIAKVPGGVGPVTVISLLQNVIIASKNSQ